jgi:hypothetical protein
MHEPWHRRPEGPKLRFELSFASVEPKTRDHLSLPDVQTTANAIY